MSMCINLQSYTIKVQPWNMLLLANKNAQDTKLSIELFTLEKYMIKKKEESLSVKTISYNMVISYNLKILGLIRK